MVSLPRRIIFIFTIRKNLKCHKIKHVKFRATTLVAGGKPMTEVN
jgi:hypothetical protein